MDKTTLKIQTREGIVTVKGYARWYDLDGLRVDLVVHRSIVNPRYWAVSEKNTGLGLGVDGVNRIEAFQHAVDRLNHAGRKNTEMAISKDTQRSVQNV